jgi:hypothetical protein
MIMNAFWTADEFDACGLLSAESEPCDFGGNQVSRKIFERQMSEKSFSNKHLN